MTNDPSTEQGLPPAGSAARADACSVLVVDDSRLQRRILQASLTRWGYLVYEAASGEEALQICKHVQPDLVISDWMMPGMDGLEFCKAFRALDRRSYGYFILLTSKSEKDEVARGLENGADDFVTKPVNPAELRARLMAGQRILGMERELTRKNRLIEKTLEQLQSLYESIDTDLLEARKLQQSLLRDRYRDFGAASVSLVLQPSGHVGGDLVGYFPIGSGRVGLFGLDVSGHGISSALMTARLAGYLSYAAPEQNIAMEEAEEGGYRPIEPSRVVEHLNQLVLDEMQTEHYFTMLLADVDLESGRVRMAQAGHPHPLILRRDGGVFEIGAGGLPVGLIPGACYEGFEILLAPGDSLLIFSDGIVECPSPSGELLGEEGLAKIVADMRDLAGPQFLETLIWKLSDFADDGDFPDDVSAVLLEYHGPPP